MKFKHIFMAIIMLIGWIYSFALGQQQQVTYLSADSLKKHQSIWLTNNWKFHSGDNHKWANPTYDDRSWKVVSTGLRQNEIAEVGWQGIGWFRRHLVVDSTLWHLPLAIDIEQAGKTEIFLDGKLIYKSGPTNSLVKKIFYTPNQNNYTIFSFTNKPAHVISVRYTNVSDQTFIDAGFPAGFFIRIGFPENYIKNNLDNTTENLSYQMFFIALILAFGILHLILYLYSPGLKSNLYYAIYLFLSAAGTFFDYQHFFDSTISDELFFIRIHRATIPFVNIFLLRFIYALFRSKLPRQFWIFSTGFIFFGILAVVRPVENFTYLILFNFFLIMEILRVIYLAIRNKKDGAWIIASGFFILTIFGAYDALLDLEVISMINEMPNAYMFGSVGLFICMSVYLAREFAKRNEKIIEQQQRTQEMKIQQRLLEAESQRKSKELEEARQLQLSMLPECRNDIPGIDICFHMDPATEVGGDYYDYHVTKDGTLTLVIGDATGHGMKAGMMVSIIKSLFIADGADTEIVTFFKKCTKTIRQMRLGNLYMALMLVKIKNNEMIASAAGMPPILIHRDKTKSVEEITIKGMPLGGPGNFPYQMNETRLESGDTLLLMSDGFPELFNAKNEMLDYPQIKELFKEAAPKSVNGIVTHLCEAGKKWSQERPQDDDITFVVLKVK